MMRSYVINRVFAIDFALPKRLPQEQELHWSFVWMHTLNENPDKLPRGWFSASFFAKRSNQLQLQSSLKWRPPVCQGEGATSRGLLPTTQKIFVFNLLTQLLSELFFF